MKRKILLVFSILLLFLISCGQDKNKDVDEQLTEPEYETTSVEAKEIKEGIKVIDGWKVIESEANGKKVYVYAPYIENKLKGVSYWEDSIDVDFNINKIINADMPNGCIATEQKVWSDNVNCSFQPNLGLNEYDSTRVNPKNELRYIRPVKQYYKVLSDNNTDLNQITEYTAPKVDVQAVSFALYEDFLSEDGQYVQANSILDLCPDLLEDEILLVEYPVLKNNPLSPALLNEASINLLVVRANRTWKDTDQLMYKRLL